MRFLSSFVDDGLEMPLHINVQNNSRWTKGLAINDNYVDLSLLIYYWQQVRESMWLGKYSLLTDGWPVPDDI